MTSCLLSEWQDGAKLCQRLLSNEVTIMQFSQQLVAIAQYYRIDGWLVNIENPIHVSHPPPPTPTDTCSTHSHSHTRTCMHTCTHTHTHTIQSLTFSNATSPFRPSLRFSPQPSIACSRWQPTHADLSAHFWHARCLSRVKSHLVRQCH